MKKVAVNGNETKESKIIADNACIEITHNDENIQICGEHNEVIVIANSSNLHIYGDYGSLKIVGNQANLHIYGDHLTVVVENNTSNLHIYGTHNDVSVLKGSAVVYGYYGNVTIHPEAEVEALGEYKEINKV